MSILTRWWKAIETLNEDEMNACLHDDYKFTMHASGKVLTKQDVIQWAMSDDINRDKVRIIMKMMKLGLSTHL